MPSSRSCAAPISPSSGWNEVLRRRRARDLESPVGHLFPGGQSRTRQFKFRPVFAPVLVDDPLIEPKLGSALAELSESQRTAVVLVHSLGWTLREVAELREVHGTRIQPLIERALDQRSLSAA